MDELKMRLFGLVTTIESPILEGAAMYIVLKHEGTGNSSSNDYDYMNNIATKLATTTDAYLAKFLKAYYLESKESILEGNPISISPRILHRQAEVEDSLTSFCLEIANNGGHPQMKSHSDESNGAYSMQSQAEAAVAAADTYLSNTINGPTLRTVCPWLENILSERNIEVVLKEALDSSWSQLTSEKSGVQLIGSMDFGLRRCGYEESNSTEDSSRVLDSKHQGWTSVPPGIPLHPKPRRFFRSLIILNINPSAHIVLVDIRGVPSMQGSVIVHHDFKSAYPWSESKASGWKGVHLPPGSEYEVTVELCCPPQNPTFLQQWLLVTFANLEAEGSLFVIGRRVAAVIAKSETELQAVMDTEAKPYFPARLRQLFDSPPSYFIVSTPATLLPWMHSWMVPSVPAHILARQLSMRVSVHWSREADMAARNKECSCSLKQLTQLERLLGIEEASMQHRIKSFDMFNARLTLWKDPWSQPLIPLYCLSVPGLSENRPCVHYGDIVYIRPANMDALECLAYVHAVEHRPLPRIFLAISPQFIASVGGQISIQQEFEACLFHVRFTFDKLPFARMHAAIQRCKLKGPLVMPCSCAHSPARPIKALPDPPLKPINPLLNEEQRAAVQEFVSGSFTRQPFIIFGPPGTGKTVTVIEIALQLLKKDPGYRVCVCAPANFAADLLCSGIANGGITPRQMWRLNDPRRMHASVKEDIIGHGLGRNFCTFNEMHQLFDLHPNPQSLRVVVTTCGSAAMLHESTLRGHLTFSHILVDEAGQALVPEVLIPLTLAASRTSILLCGDPKQLGPVVHSPIAAERGLSLSLLERLMDSERLPDRAGNSGLVTKLVRNYRSNSKLLDLPSRMFYSGQLIANAELASVTIPCAWEAIQGSDFPMLFFGVKGQQMRDSNSPSYFNPVEAIQLVELLEGLLKHRQVSVGDIGVMAPYRSQVQKLRLLLRRKNLGDIRVGTVDDYQGQEEKVIFISTVITKLVSNGRENDDIGCGLLGNSKRFNVAITRAKALMVVVGHPLVLMQDKNWFQLLKYCISRDAYRGAGVESMPAYIHGLNPGMDWLQPAAPSERSSSTVSEMEDINEAIERIAELSLLGTGHKDRVFPETLPDMYSAYNDDESEWRVVL